MKFPNWRRLPAAAAVAAAAGPEQETDARSGCNGWGRVLAADWASILGVSRRAGDDAAASAAVQEPEHWQQRTRFFFSS